MRMSPNNNRWITRSIKNDLEPYADRSASTLYPIGGLLEGNRNRINSYSTRMCFFKTIRAYQDIKDGTMNPR